MAVGRQDYQAGVVPIKSGYSLVQTPIFKVDLADIVAGANDYMSNYVVPVGHELHVTGIRVSCDFPGVQYALLDIDGVGWLAFFYDMVLIDNLPEGSPKIVKAGEEVSIRLWNESPITNWYNSNIIGYLEQIET